jgi:CRP/FNR family transcriptional regulator
MDKVDPEILSLIRNQFPMISEPALQEAIAKVSQILEFKAGEVIMDFGQYVRMVPLVVKGSIKVVREDDDSEREIFLYFLSSGDTCSMSFSCCMMNKKSDIRTTAEDDTMIIGIPIKNVDEWMMKYPSWKNFIMSSYDQRMQELVRTIDSIAFNNMDERLLAYLDKKSAALDSKLIQTTHQDIAYDLNASREAVSRLLKALEQKGKIKLGRNKIELL